jgi:hypothetical protein
LAAGPQRAAVPQALEFQQLSRQVLHLRSVGFSLGLPGSDDLWNVTGWKRTLYSRKVLAQPPARAASIVREERPYAGGGESNPGEPPQYDPGTRACHNRTPLGIPATPTGHEVVPIRAFSRGGPWHIL